MPAVVSKFLDKTDQTSNILKIPATYIAGTLLATSFVYYVGYPLVEKCIRHDKSPKLTENNNSWPKNGVKTKEIVKKAENGRHVGNQLSKNKVMAIASKIPALNLEFINQFLRLARIMIPSYLCRETVLLSGHTIFLLLRTFLSIYVANMEGAIVKYIVRKDATNFAKMLLKWFSVALPATFINSMIRYLESKIALSFR